MQFQQHRALTIVVGVAIHRLDNFVVQLHHHLTFKKKNLALNSICYIIFMKNSNKRVPYSVFADVSAIEQTSECAAGVEVNLN